MEGLLDSFGVIGGLFNVTLVLLWLLVPVFIFLISKRVKEMRDIAKESIQEIKALNTYLSQIKRKDKESVLNNSE